MVCNLYRNKVVSENQLDKSDLEFRIKLNPTASGHLRQIQRQSKHQRRPKPNRVTIARGNPPESTMCPTQSRELNKAEPCQLPNPVVWTEKFHATRRQGHRKPTPKNTLVQRQNIHWKSKHDRKQARLNMGSEIASLPQTSPKANIRPKKWDPSPVPALRQARNTEATKKIKIHKGQLILCAILRSNKNWEIKTHSRISSNFPENMSRIIKKKKNYKTKLGTITRMFTVLPEIKMKYFHELILFYI